MRLLIPALVSWVLGAYNKLRWLKAVANEIIDCIKISMDKLDMKEVKRLINPFLPVLWSGPKTLA